MNGNDLHSVISWEDLAGPNLGYAIELYNGICVTLTVSMPTPAPYWRRWGRLRLRL